MGLNRHVYKKGDQVCFYCGRTIEKDEHALDFQGSNEDGTGYKRIWLHLLCSIELNTILSKDTRHAMYHERMKLTTMPRNAKTKHLKIDNYRVREPE